MANAEHLAILEKGVGYWNEWRKNKESVQPDLCEANLSLANLSPKSLSINLSRAELRRANLSYDNLGAANLSEANLSEANLRKANLSRADLTGAKLSRADLNDANLTWAKLSRADLTGANLSLASFFRADLTGAKLSRVHLTGANLSRANLNRADLSSADLREAILIRTNLDGANLTGASIFGISAWDLSLEGTIQKNLIIQGSDENAPITLDDLEVAQFIYLLLNRRKLRNVITTLGEKVVLILGRFTERKELLDSMATKLRELDYLPIIFDFERPVDRDLTDTVKVLAGLSRFVIADVTNPRSVPYELGATVPDYMVPFVTILQRGQPAFGMFDDLPRRYHWALPLLEYQSAKTLLAAFESKVIAPAQEKLEEVRRQKALVPPRRSAED